MKKVVLLNGCFDLLHVGHIALLQTAHAQACGGFVFVAIDSDERVAQLKGPDRPYICAKDRKTMLLATKYVDAVFIFNSDQELLALYSSIRPDVTVKGYEYMAKPIIGATYCKEIVFHDSTEHRSSEIASKFRPNSG